MKLAKWSPTVLGHVTSPTTAEQEAPSDGHGGTAVGAGWGRFGGLLIQHYRDVRQLRGQTAA
jgi:hypothetical protein